MKHQVRTTHQDVDIARITADPAAQRLYLELHFTTVEFDYDTGVQFLGQWMNMLEHIAPPIPIVEPPPTKPQ